MPKMIHLSPVQIWRNLQAIDTSLSSPLQQQHQYDEYKQQPSSVELVAEVIRKNILELRDQACLDTRLGYIPPPQVRSRRISSPERIRAFNVPSTLKVPVETIVAELKRLLQAAAVLRGENSCALYRLTQVFATLMMMMIF